MAQRTEWANLPWVFINNQAHLMTADAAAYLGMHEKAFLRLAGQLKIQPDSKLRGMNLYTRGTLDRIDHLRKLPGRPKLPQSES